MGNEHQTIREFKLNLISDFFANMERQGPGSPQTTLQALGFIEPLTDQSVIADLGCGTGGQTMILAQNALGTITGVDFSPQFIELFNRKAHELGLQKRVKGVVGSMENLPFKKSLWT